MSNLSLVPSSTSVTAPPGVKIISSKEAAEQYAAFLALNSNCVDVSSYPVKLLHSRSNRNKSSDSISLSFPAWTKANTFRVNTKDYAGFLRGLPTRVMSLLPQVVGSSFRPVNTPFFTCTTGAELANTFVPFYPARPPFPMLAPAILEEYFSRLFENAQDRLYVMQFLADIFQNPMRRPMWSIVITGEQGTGKSILHALVTLALGGRHAIATDDPSTIFKQFSEKLPDNLLVSIDDDKSRRDIYQDLKQAITRTSTQVELKREQKLVYREDYSRIATFSNLSRPYIIEPGDRRMYAAEKITHKSRFNPEGCTVNTAEFFARFIEWMERPEAPAILYYYFMDTDLTGFKPGSTIQTDTHKEMVGLSTSALDNLLTHFIEGDYRFHQNELLAHLKGNGVSNANLDSIKKKLTEAGYVHARRMVVGFDKQQDIWQKKVARSTPLTEEEEGRISSFIAVTPRAFSND